jgi:hypothetical protein
LFISLFRRRISKPPILNDLLNSVWEFCEYEGGGDSDSSGEDANEDGIVEGEVYGEDEG